MLDDEGTQEIICQDHQSRADMRGDRIFLDVCGPKSVRSMWGKEYMLLVKDDFLGFLLCTL